MRTAEPASGMVEISSPDNLSWTIGDGHGYTAAALRGTQQLARIPVNGIVGLQTWAIPVHAGGQVLANLCGVTGPGGG